MGNGPCSDQATRTYDVKNGGVLEPLVVLGEGFPEANDCIDASAQHNRLPSNGRALILINFKPFGRKTNDVEHAHPACVLGSKRSKGVEQVVSRKYLVMTVDDGTAQKPFQRERFEHVQNAVMLRAANDTWQAHHIAAFGDASCCASPLLTYTARPPAVDLGALRSSGDLIRYKSSCSDDKRLRQFPKQCCRCTSWRRQYPGNFRFLSGHDPFGLFITLTDIVSRGHCGKHCEDDRDMLVALPNRHASADV